jgi:hypothetical protein
MRADFYPSDEYASDEVVNSPLSSPAEVLLDRSMPKEAKRALLAAWASDLRAVENQPALRQLGDGTFLHIDDILDALKALDTSTDPTKVSKNVMAFSRRPIGIRAGVGTNEDDDPPPGRRLSGDRCAGQRNASWRGPAAMPMQPRSGKEAMLSPPPARVELSSSTRPA